MRNSGIKRTILAITALATFAMAAPSIVSAQEATDEKIKIVQSSDDINVHVNDGKVVIKKNGKVVKTVDLSQLELPKGKVTGEHRFEIVGSEDGLLLSTDPRAVLIGPDGPHKTQIGQLTLSADSNFDEVVQLITDAENGMPDFAIGVSCSSLPEALSAQLKLKNGLVVDRVFADSAAKSAGLSQHDIILRIDGTDVKETQQLVDAIQEAGKAEGAVTMKIMRVGEEMSVDVKPVKRTTSASDSRQVAELIFDGQKGRALSGNLLGGNLKTKVLRSGGGDAIELRQILPGMIQEKIARKSESSDSLAKEIAELRNQIEQLREEIRNK